jgi:hypothetical protein
MTRLARVLHVAVVVALAAFPSHADAQKSKSSGFYLGVGLEGNGVSTTNNGTTTTESGSGAALTLGYGFSDRWSLYGQASGASINADGGGTYTLAHVDIGARVHFRTGPNVVVPFLQFGLAGRAISQEILGSTVTGNGGGVSAGVGLNAHFTPTFAFTGAVTWTVGSFDKFAVNGQSIGTGSINATTARVQVGVVWFQ